MSCKTEKFMDKYPCDLDGEHLIHEHALATPQRVSLFKYKTRVISWSTEKWKETHKGVFTKTATHEFLRDIPQRDLFLGRF